MKKSTCIECKTSNCFIKFCSDEWLNKLESQKQTCEYKKDHNIVYEGDEVLGLYFIKEGKAKVYSTGLNEKKQVVRLAKMGEIIGHRGYGGEVYPIGASVLEDSIICFFDNRVIYKAFMNNPKLTCELMMYYSKELRSSEGKIKKLAQMNVREKVIEGLLYSKKIYNQNDQGETVINIERQDLADLIGINTEQLSRSLSELKKEGSVSLARNQITIKKEKVLAQIISQF